MQRYTLDVTVDYTKLNTVTSSVKLYIIYSRIQCLTLYNLQSHPVFNFAQPTVTSIA